MQRGAGILMPISALPCKYGIGSFGEGAYLFVDFLKAAGQKYWQVWNRTQSDPEYARMFAQMAQLEARFESVMEQLPDDTQNIIRDFVMHCEDMSRRVLECACEEILFGGEEI
jgi:4-alpha-glucanotransferase